MANSEIPSPAAATSPNVIRLLPPPLFAPAPDIGTRPASDRRPCETGPRSRLFDVTRHFGQLLP